MFSSKRHTKCPLCFFRRRVSSRASSNRLQRSKDTEGQEKTRFPLHRARSRVQRTSNRNFGQPIAYEKNVTRLRGFSQSRALQSLDPTDVFVFRRTFTFFVARVVRALRIARCRARLWNAIDNGRRNVIHASGELRKCRGCRVSFYGFSTLGVLIRTPCGPR